MNIRAFILHMSISCDKIFLFVFVLVTVTIFGIGHYRGHLCFTNTSCSLFVWLSISSLLIGHLSHNLDKMISLILSYLHKDLTKPEFSDMSLSQSEDSLSLNITLLSSMIERSPDLIFALGFIL